MLYKKLIFIFAFFFFSFLLFAQRLEIPFTETSGQIILRDFYALEYSEKHEQALWVAYELTRNEIMGNMKRTDDFRVDPFVLTGSAILEDYFGSGYDRGHLAPAADMKMSYRSMSESFYLSNISPQHPSFNRGIWRVLETFVRKYVLYSGSVLIVTGPVFSFSDSFIGLSEVTVPWGFYKVILGRNGGIGFVMENKKLRGDIFTYAVTIDRVEKITDINFFPFLSSDQEKNIEGYIADDFIEISKLQ